MSLRATQSVASVPSAVLRVALRPNGLRSVATALILCACTIAGGALAARLSWPLALPVLLVTGFFANGLVQLGHEAWHGNLFASRILNSAFGYSLALASGVPFGAARYAHHLHHRHNRTERDPDAYNVGARSFRTWLQFYVVVLLGLPLAPLHFGVLFPAVFMRGSRLAAHVCECALLAALWLAIYRWILVPHALGGALLYCWVLPYLAATPWNGLKSISDHYANRFRGDRYQTATTVRSNRLVTWVWSGLNYHLEHHLYPRVPGPALPGLHPYLASEFAARGAPVFASYARVFWRAFLAGPTYDESASPFLSRTSRTEPDR